MLSYPAEEDELQDGHLVAYLDILKFHQEKPFIALTALEVLEFLATTTEGNSFLRFSEQSEIFSFFKSRQRILLIRPESRILQIFEKAENFRPLAETEGAIALGGGCKEFEDSQSRQCDKWLFLMRFENIQISDQVIILKLILLRRDDGADSFGGRRARTWYFSDLSSQKSVSAFVGSARESNNQLNLQWGQEGHKYFGRSSGYPIHQSSVGFWSRSRMYHFLTYYPVSLSPKE
jgi:hypothetical protein